MILAYHKKFYVPTSLYKNSPYLWAVFNCGEGGNLTRDVVSLLKTHGFQYFPTAGKHVFSRPLSSSNPPSLLQ